MCRQGIHGVGVLRDQAGLVLVRREEHVVQQVNIGIPAQGVVQGMVGVVHGDQDCGIGSKRVFWARPKFDLMMTINDYSFFLKNLKKRNQITISSVTTVWKDHNWRLNEMLQCFWYGVSKKSLISMFQFFPSKAESVFCAMHGLRRSD